MNISINEDKNLITILEPVKLDILIVFLKKNYPDNWDQWSIVSTSINIDLGKTYPNYIPTSNNPFGPFFEPPDIIY